MGNYAKSKKTTPKCYNTVQVYLYNVLKRTKFIEMNGIVVARDYQAMRVQGSGCGYTKAT